MARMALGRAQGTQGLPEVNNWDGSAQSVHFRHIPDAVIGYQSAGVHCAFELAGNSPRRARQRASSWSSSCVYLMTFTRGS